MEVLQRYHFAELIGIEPLQVLRGGNSPCVRVGRYLNPQTYVVFEDHALVVIHRICKTRWKSCEGTLRRDEPWEHLQIQSRALSTSKFSLHPTTLPLTAFNVTSLQCLHLISIDKALVRLIACIPTQYNAIVLVYGFWGRLRLEIVSYDGAWPCHSN